MKLLGKENYRILTITGIVLLVLSCDPATKNNSASENQNKNSMNTPLKLQMKADGEGTPLLLVPGGLTGWASWEPFVETFKAKQRKVIRVQLLAVEYGLEDRPLPVAYSVKAESEALAAALGSLGDTTALDIVAWSYGALISLEYALANPGRVRTLTLIEPPGIWILRARNDLDAEIQRTIDFFKTFQGDITEDMLAGFLVEAGFVKPGQSPRELPQWQQWVPFRRSLRQNPFVANHRGDLKPVQDFKPPVLLVKGTGSSPWLHRVIDALEANLPNARVIELPGGHAPHIVSRDQFLIEVEKFQN